MRAYKKDWKKYITPEELAKKLGDRIKQSALMPELMRDVLWERICLHYKERSGEDKVAIYHDIVDKMEAEIRGTDVEITVEVALEKTKEEKVRENIKH